MLYGVGVPKLWDETVASHREAVRDAVLEAAWQLVAERGLSGVSMSQVAERAGIARATLYKYFPDVGAIVLAWHEREVTSHLQQLAAIRARNADPAAALQAVLAGYAGFLRHRGRHGAGLVSFLHRDTHLEPAQQHLLALIEDVLAQAAAAGAVRTDTPPRELAAYCLHALAAAADAPGDASVHRLVDLVTAGLRPGA